MELKNQEIELQNPLSNIESTFEQDASVKSTLSTAQHKENDFQIVHSFRFQPNLLNVLSGIGGNSQKIIHITGLGIAFSNKSLKYQILKFISQFIFLIKFYFANNIIVQNPDDIYDIWASKFFKSKIQHINGSGVDTIKFSPESYEKRQIRTSSGIHTLDGYYNNQQSTFLQ